MAEETLPLEDPMGLLQQYQYMAKRQEELMGLHQRYDKCYGFHGKDELPRVSWDQMFLVFVDNSRLGCCARYEGDTETCEKKERDSLDVCLLEWHIYYRILKSTNTWRGIY